MRPGRRSLAVRACRRHDPRLRSHEQALRHLAGVRADLGRSPPPSCRPTRARCRIRPARSISCTRSASCSSSRISTLRSPRSIALLKPGGTVITIVLQPAEPALLPEDAVLLRRRLRSRGAPRTAPARGLVHPTDSATRRRTTRRPTACGRPSAGSPSRASSCAISRAIRSRCFRSTSTRRSSGAGWPAGWVFYLMLKARK